MRDGLIATGRANGEALGLRGASHADQQVRTRDRMICGPDLWPRENAGGRALHAGCVDGSAWHVLVFNSEEGWPALA